MLSTLRGVLSHPLLRCPTIPRLVPIPWSVVSLKVCLIETFFTKVQEHLGCQYCPDILVRPSPTSGFSFEGSYLQNYNALSVVIWAEMSDTTFAVCQQYGIEA